MIHPAAANAMGANYQDHAGKSASEPSTERSVLLRNGNLVQGKVENTDRGYRVTMGSGVRLSLGPSDVQYIGQSTHDVYHWLLERIASEPAAPLANHVELVRWCLRVDLMDEAQREIDRLRSMGADAQVLEMLQRQIEAARHRLRLRDEANSSKPPAAGPTEFPLELPPPAELLPADSADGPQPVPTAPLFTEAQFRVFRTQIQPLLVQSCATAGCHTAADPVMPLVRAYRSDPRFLVDSRFNFNSASRWIQADDPLRSPLLPAARGPHAGHEHLLDAESLQALQRWVRSFADPSLLDDTVVAHDSLPQPPTIRAMSGSELEAGDTGTTIHAAMTAPPPEPAAESQSARSSGTERDPYDPEVFNRMMRQRQRQRDATGDSPPHTTSPGAGL